jgi:hypothetical protein
MSDSKYTAFHVPRSSPVLGLARKLAAKLQEDSSVAGLRVPMYAAIHVALTEALARRHADTVPAEALTRRTTDTTDQSMEVDR